MEPVTIVFAVLDASELVFLLRQHATWIASGGRNGKRAKLARVDLSGRDLSGVNLAAADLEFAVLVGTTLRNALLAAANLQGANLIRADLMGAELRGANLRNANLRDAVLADAKLGELPDTGLFTLLEGAGDITDKEVLDSALIASAQAVEHYEITRYGTLIAWAHQLGRDDCAAVLQKNLDEEKATDKKLTALAESTVSSGG